MTLRLLPTLGDLSGRTILVRCDLNVPLHNGEITDDGRIRASIPTISALRSAGARTVLISHLGRPAGTPDPALSLRPVAARLAELIGVAVEFAEDTVGDAALSVVDQLQPGGIALLENLRFSASETSKDEAVRREFAAELARFGDAFVSDGFGVVHRKQASVYELAQLLPSAAGLLVARECDVLERLSTKPEHPYTVVLGGSKVSDKLGVIEHLLPRVDTLVIGGGMMFTFLAAAGHSVGASLLESDQIDRVRGYLADAERRGVRIMTPSDVVVGERFAADAAHEITAADTMESTPWGTSGIGLDIGPATAAEFAQIIRDSATVFWNGPMGVFEFEAFSRGTFAIAEALTQVSGLAVVGGGDSAAAVRKLGFSDDAFGHISTGGGASLEFLEGAALPGLEVLGWEAQS